MNTKLISVSAIALVIGAGSAMADGNNALLEQIGAGNSASIDQDGSGNRFGGQVGSWGSSSVSPINDGSQVGSGNDLDLVQSGDGNTVGLSRRGNPNGFSQNGSDNSAVISQTSNTNIVNVISQDNSGSTGGTNTLEISQGGTAGASAYAVNVDQFGATLANVTQTNTGSNDNSVSVSQFADSAAVAANAGNYDRNRIGGGSSRGVVSIFGDTALNANSNGVIQNGDGNAAQLAQDGANNLIVLTSQTGSDNLLRVVQVGVTNRVDSVLQDTNGSTSGGNTAIVRQIGDRNGEAGFALTWAASAGVASSTVTQIGGDNYARYVARGNDNDFGISQIGESNTVGNVIVRGDGNETGIRQEGDFNIASIAPVVGNDNDIGVIQEGDSNDTMITLTNGSDRNSLGVTQVGIGNVADLFIDGNNNGEGTFGGYAAGLGLSSGLVLQDNSAGGLGNTFDGLVEGNRNVFASSQIGAGNDITASVDGNRNQFAIAQAGNANSAMLMQVGNGNNAGISQ